jgi:hypothetical protein
MAQNKKPNKETNFKKDTWDKVSKEIYAISESKNLNWNWQFASKFASLFIYPDFKEQRAYKVSKKAINAKFKKVLAEKIASGEITIVKDNEKIKQKRAKGRKTWNKVSKRVYELSIKNKLNWKWSFASKFASSFVYSEFKKRPSHLILKKEIDEKFNEALKKYLEPEPIEEQPEPTPPEDICDNPLDNLIAEDIVAEKYWYNINDDFWNYIKPNTQIRISFEEIGVDTGIIKSKDKPPTLEIREQLRKIYGDQSPPPQFIIRISIVPGKEDDGKPCSYYILITMEGSLDDYDTSSREKFITKTKEDLSPEEAEIRNQKDKEKEDKRKEARKRKKPKKVIPISKNPAHEKERLEAEAAAKKESESTEKLPFIEARYSKKEVELMKIALEENKLKTENIANLNKILDRYFQEYKEGILTVKEYKSLTKNVRAELDKLLEQK